MITWITLIGGCRLHDDLERGKKAAEQLFLSWPAITASYILLANLYAAKGLWIEREIPFEKPWKDQAKRKSLGHPGYTLEADSLLKVHQKATLYETIK